ncbi:hypothetical protein GCM10010978_28180 [Compostibacillus humi]|uniref:Uncharacterized protein n=1 Tax=Compostibacillus humi TaxID=1245525 RepID=A0A8J2TUL8_9BACI|nr:hypothetical protein GCM10010978_28180 [Compostibacillus humi]
MIISVDILLRTLALFNLLLFDLVVLSIIPIQVSKKPEMPFLVLPQLAAPSDVLVFSYSKYFYYQFIKIY